MSDYAELLARLADATDDELTTARDAIAARFDELAPEIEKGTVSAELLDEAEALGTAHSQICEQLAERVTAAAERTERAAAALALVRPPATETEEPVETDAPAAEVPAQEEAPAEAAPEPVAAAARPALGRVSAASQQGAMQYSAAAQAQPVAMAAAADVKGFATGQALRNRDELAVAFARKLDSLRRVSGGNGEHVNVATFTAPKAQDPRRLRTGDFAGNNRRLREQDPEALVAAGGNGGICAPFVPDYSVDVVGSTGTPIRSTALNGYQADQGGIQFRKDIAGVNFGTSGFGVWTNDDDALVGDDTDPPDAKPHAVLACPGFTEAEVEAETFQIEISNVTARFDPEATRAELDAAQVAFDRWRENRLFSKMAAGSTLITHAVALGGTRDLLAMLDQVIAYFRSYYRVSDNVPLRMVAPTWVQNLVRVDLLRAMQTSNMDYFSVKMSQIETWLRDRGVNVTWHLDGSIAAVTGPPAIARQQYAGPLSANAAIPGFPDQAELLLYPEGKWIGLDGGTLDLGIVRDSGLVESNRYRIFMEEWFAPAFKGVESFRVSCGLQPSGASVGTVPPVTTATPQTD